MAPVLLPKVTTILVTIDPRKIHVGFIHLDMEATVRLDHPEAPVSLGPFGIPL